MGSIVPAILPKTRAELEGALARLARVRGVSEVQIDVVDGRFAAPASWPYTESSQHTAHGKQEGEMVVSLPYAGRFGLDIDLMVEDPERVAGLWLDRGAQRLTLHLESLIDPARSLAAIKEHCGHETDGPCVFELGLALSMSTDLSRLTPHLAHVDYVQLMGIDTIGRQGEPFNSRVIERVRALRAAYPNLVIQVDGGVTLAVVSELLAAGADRLVVGHALVGAADLGEAFSDFSALAQLRVPHPAREASVTSERELLTDADLAALTDKAAEVRVTIVEMLVAAGSGHTAGPLGMADIFTALYFHILRHDPKNPEWEERDRLILSNGHIVPVRYAAMAHAGYFPVEECLTLRKLGSRLQGHPERTRLPGLETTSGPLGSGLAQASGMAYALRMDAMRGLVNPSSDDEGFTRPLIRSRVYCVMSDGEQQEGNTWEAAMFAGKYRLSNLTAVMDRNNIQIDGMTEEVMPLEPLADKYRAFGWHVLEVGGHDIPAFISAVEEAKAIYEKPTIIIAHTIPGRGVKEIEFDYRWHGVPPGGGPEDVWKKAEQGKGMLRELRSLGGRISHDYA